MAQALAALLALLVKNERTLLTTTLTIDSRNEKAELEFQFGFFDLYQREVSHQY